MRRNHRAGGTEHRWKGHSPALRVRERIITTWITRWSPECRVLSIASSASKSILCSLRKKNKKTNLKKIFLKITDVYESFSVYW